MKRVPHKSAKNLRPSYEKFVVRADRVACTWPAESDMEAIIQRAFSLPSFRWIVLGRERYPQSGKFHYHAHIVFDVRVVLRMSQLDELGGIHGHYQPIRSTPLVQLKYCIKDNDFLLRARDDDVREELEKAVLEAQALKYVTTEHDLYSPASTQLSLVKQSVQTAAALQLLTKK